MNITFVYHHKYEDWWRDGLWAAIKLLEKNHKVKWINLHKHKLKVAKKDFVLGWGAFFGPVDEAIKDLPNKKGLCIAGVTPEPIHSLNYNVVFYETDWFGNTLTHPNKVKAFGTNTDIFKIKEPTRIFYDYLSVGAFADWKRHELLINKAGRKIAIGEIQEDNLQESMKIAETLLKNGVSVSTMSSPERLAYLYAISSNVYIPATIFGGGERAVLEARACGCDVEVENDNPKLKELLYGSIYSHIDYARELEKGLRPWL